MTDPVTAYAESVSAGTTVAGPPVRAACQRHLRDRKRPDLTFDAAAAQRVLDFFPEVLRLPKGDHAGAPFHLLPWQQFLVGSLYGWLLPDGRRRFRRAYVETGRGTGKSPLAAGLLLYAITADGEHAAEAYCVARNADQALITFRLAAQIRDLAPALADRVQKYGGERPTRLVHHDSWSFAERTTTSDTGAGKSGLNPHLVIVDEYHEHKTSTMMERYDAGMKDRPQPLRLCITNAGSGQNIPCWDEHQYAVRVAEGSVTDDRYFAYVCALDVDDDPWADEACWVKVSPSLPVIPGLAYIRDQAAKALGMPSKRAEVERFQFCRWTDAVSPWIDPEAWDPIVVEALDEASVAEAPCVVGLDLSRTRDLTAAAAVWSLPEGRFAARAHAWTPKDTIGQRSDLESVPYSTWAAEGYLTATPGAIVDYGFVAAWLQDLVARYDVRALVYDAWGIAHFRERMAQAGLVLSETPGGGGLYAVPHKQGFGPGQAEAGRPALWMHSSLEALERAVLERTIAVERNAMLRWGVLGAAVIEDGAGNRKLSKIKEESRTDAMVALTMAMGYAVAQPPAPVTRTASDYILHELYESPAP